MGALWDFDGTFGVSEDWAHIHNGIYCFYFTELLKRDDFYTSYISLWEELRSTLLQELTIYWDKILKTKGQDISNSRAINKKQHPKDKGTPLAEEIAFAREWMIKRIDWIDSHILTARIPTPQTAMGTSPVVYDIYGRQLPQHCSLSKGVYIIDGVKFLVK